MVINKLRYRMVDNRVNSITELSARSGLNRNTLMKVYHNTDMDTVKLGTLMKLCDALHCSLRDLIEYTSDDEPER